MWGLLDSVARFQTRKKHGDVKGHSPGSAKRTLGSARRLAEAKKEPPKITANRKWTKHLDRQVDLLKESSSFRAPSREYVSLPKVPGETSPPPCPAPPPPQPQQQPQPPQPPPRNLTRDPPTAMSKQRPKHNGEGSSGEWAKNGSFIVKPSRGWLHPDRKILEEGVCYEVRYVGCLEVNTSMKILEYETRSLVAKECINRVCESAGLKTADRKRKVDRKVLKMLSEAPIMEHAGANIHLIITSISLQLRVMESGETIAVHEMPNISFASGGDTDTLDFVAYVAKDACGKRACYVLECGGKCAQEVIVTIGQAFELRFKEYLQKTRHGPEHVASSPRPPAPLSRDDPEYYNDLPGKIPPELMAAEAGSPPPNYQMATAHSRADVLNVPSSNPNYDNTSDLSPNLIDLNSEPSVPDPYAKHACPEYANDAVCNAATLPLGGASLIDSYSVRDLPALKDPFDVRNLIMHIGPLQQSSDPFDANRPAPCVFPNTTSTPTGNLGMLEQLQKEDWYHGSISRKDAEEQLHQDGEFLVRESQGAPGQYVLTGMQGGAKKHLLLVDPEGIVRTKDKTFESVSHLVYYHQSNGLPIISAESALVLRIPVPKRYLYT